jgi:hypothetical protein
MPLLRVAALALVALAAGAPAAVARNVPLDEDAASVTVTGQRVSWLVDRPGGKVALRTIAPGATTPVTAATVTRHDRTVDDDHAALATTATGWAIGTRDGKIVSGGQYDITELIGEKLTTGTWNSRVTATRSECVPAKHLDENYAPLALIASSAGFVVAGLTCGPLQGVQLLGPSGATTAFTPLLFPITPFVPVAAGDFLAFATPAPFAEGEPGSGDRLTVRDLATGSIVTSIDPGTLATPFGVDDDGTLAFAFRVGPQGARPPASLEIAAPGASTATVVPGVSVDAPVPPYSLHTVVLDRALAVGGGHVLFAPVTPPQGVFGLGLVPTTGGAVTAVGEPGAGAPRQPLSVDATQAVFTSQSCSGRAQITIVSLAATSTTPLAPAGCPARIDTTKLVLSATRHTARVPVSCPNGCTGTLGLYLPRTSTGLLQIVDGGDTSLATTKLSLPAGKTRTITLRFPKNSRRFVAKAKGLKNLSFATDMAELGPTPMLRLPAKI